MKRLLNTLYILSENAYLTLDGENVVARKCGEETGRVPLHTLESIVSFSYAGASPALMGACAEHGIALSFFSRKGQFLARTEGARRGNVLLRRQQFRLSDDPQQSLTLARNFIIGKVFNAKWVLERALRDHKPRINTQSVRKASGFLDESLTRIRCCTSAAELRGVEGDAAATYFGVFDELILREKETFAFTRRIKRPPTDPVNAMLSLFYTVLSNDCAAALEGVGLDPYVGFLHVDRPGRMSLALDLMEELRAVMVDRFVATCINNRIIKAEHFETRESGEVRLASEGRRALFETWQNRKRGTLTHPFLKEKMPWGLIPHIQAQLLARCIRGDLDGYPPFLWK